MNRSRLMVRLTGKHTSTIRKFNGREWVSAGYFMDMVNDGELEPDAYTIEYKCMEIK